MTCAVVEPMQLDSSVDPVSNMTGDDAQVSNSTPSVQVQSKTGLEFPQTRILRIVNRNAKYHRWADCARVATTAVDEYIIAYIIARAAELTQGQGKKRIEPHHISTVIRGSPSLNAIFKNLIFAKSVVDTNQLRPFKQ